MGNCPSTRNRNVARRSMLAFLLVPGAFPYVRSGKSAKIVIRSLGTNGRVFRTDSLVDVAFLFALKVIQYVPAPNIYVAGSGDLVPELFQPNCRVRLPLRPQGRRTFATGHDSGMPPLHGFLCRYE